MSLKEFPSGIFLFQVYRSILYPVLSWAESAGFELSELDANETPVLCPGSNLEGFFLYFSCFWLFFLTEFLRGEQSPIIHNFLSSYRELEQKPPGT